MSETAIALTYIIMSYILIGVYISIYQMLDKIKAHKTGKFVEYWNEHDIVPMLMFSPIAIILVTLYELNKVRNIIISKLASSLVDFDLSKVKNIF